MDDVLALQDACLRDRQERDQWHHAFLAEQAKCKNLEIRLEREAEYAAKMAEAVALRRKAQQAEVSAAVSYEKTLSELTALQQVHLEMQQAHRNEMEELRKQLEEARRTATDLAAALDAERTGRRSEVEELNQRLEARAAAAAAEVSALHENYGGRLSLLEDFKNQLLADKAAGEERWGKERAALQAATATAAAQSGSVGEAAWKARLMRLRAEVEGLRRERDAAHAAMRVAGMMVPPPSGPPAPPASGPPAPPGMQLPPQQQPLSGAGGYGGEEGLGVQAGYPLRHSLQQQQQQPGPMPHLQAPQQQPRSLLRGPALAGPRMALAGGPPRPGAGVGAGGGIGGVAGVGVGVPPAPLPGPAYQPQQLHQQQQQHQQQAPGGLAVGDGGADAPSGQPAGRLGGRTGRLGTRR